MRRWPALLLAALAACGKPAETENPAGYEAWQTRNFILSQGFSGGGMLDGTITIGTERDSGKAGDWIEVALNGTTLDRAATGTGAAQIGYDVQLRPGANWIRFFSSASRQGWEFQVDTRSGTRFAFTPKDKVDWNMTQEKDE